jgi:hypothetical protein
MGAAKEEKPARSFSVFAATVADGDLNREVSEALHDLSNELQTDALRRNAVSKGTLTVKLNLSIDPRGQVVVGWDCATREPKPPRTGGVMWIDKDGYMVAENPRQQKLPLHEVPNERRFAEVGDKRGKVGDYSGRAAAKPNNDNADDWDPETGEVEGAGA